MPLKLIRTVDPTVLVVSDAAQKVHAKITLTDDDAMVVDLNLTAIEYIEDRLERGFLTQTWELTLDKFPPSGCLIGLSRSPAISVGSVKYINTDNVLTTLATTEYTLDDKAEPPSIVEAFEKTWPDTREVINAVTILFDVGYGPLATDTPEKFKTIIKQMFTHLYRHREPMKDKTWVEIPEHLNALISKYELKVLG